MRLLAWGVDLPTAKPGPWFEEAVRRGLISQGVSARLPLTNELPDGITEEVFQSRIIELAEAHGWQCYHTYDSRRSRPGFPDLTLVRAGVLIFAELKVNKNTTSAAQERWLEALAAVPGICVRRWRPEHWPAIIAELTKGIK